MNARRPPDSAQAPRDVIAAHMTEEALQDNIIALCKTLRLGAYHTHNSQFSAKGFPDLVIANGRRLYFVELKNARRATTPEQDQWLDWLRVTGVDGPVKTFVWRPKDWLDGVVEEVLKEMAAA